MSTLKLYGAPLSQPFRAVAWTLLQQQLPFTVQLAVPGATTSIGSRNQSYLDLTGGRTHRVPLLQVTENGRDGSESVVLFESAAILMYLSEQHGWSHLYPASESSAKQKALIDCYLHWHHGGSRQLSSLVRPFIRPDLNLDVQEANREVAKNVLATLEGAWLQDTSFLAGDDHHSIADILLYEEVAQVYMTNVVDVSDYPNITAWTKRMQQVPFHEEAHAALPTLGSLAEESTISLQDRLRQATKAGLTAINEAVESFE